MAPTVLLLTVIGAAMVILPLAAVVFSVTLVESLIGAVLAIDPFVFVIENVVPALD